MTTDVDALVVVPADRARDAVVSVLQFFGVLVVLLVLDIRLSLVVVAILPVLVVATIVFRARSSNAYTEARERISAVNASLQENLSGLRVTQAFDRTPESTARFRGTAYSYLISRLRAQRYIATYFPFVLFLSDLAAALVLAVGAGAGARRRADGRRACSRSCSTSTCSSPRLQQLSQVFDWLPAGGGRAAPALRAAAAADLDAAGRPPPPGHLALRRAGLRRRRLRLRGGADERPDRPRPAPRTRPDRRAGRGDGPPASRR